MQTTDLLALASLLPEGRCQSASRVPQDSPDPLLYRLAHTCPPLSGPYSRKATTEVSTKDFSARARGGNVTIRSTAMARSTSSARCGGMLNSDK